VYTNDNVYGWSQYAQNRIALGNLAAGENHGPHNFQNSTTLAIVTAVGTGKGIQCVAEKVRHEQEHFVIYNKFWNKPGVDSDGDWIFNTDETIYGGMSSDPNKADTYNVATYYNYTPYAQSGDREIRCLLRELDVDDKIKVFPEKDWANPGCQHKQQFGPPPQTNP
jgi:hypothetical protein